MNTKKIKMIYIILCFIACGFAFYCCTGSCQVGEKIENYTKIPTPTLSPTPTPTPQPTPTGVLEESKTVVITCPDDSIMIDLVGRLLEEKAVEEIPEPTPANPYAEMIDNLTEYETLILCQIVVKECIDEPLDGQRAVIEVIFNRVLSTLHPNTVEKVLSQKGQFSTWPYRNYAKEKDIETIKGVLQIVHDSDYVILPNLDYIYFSTKKQKYAKNYVTIQGHNFGTDLSSTYVLTEEDEEAFYNRLTK